MAKKKPIRKRVDSPFAKNLQLILEEREISQRGAAATDSHWPQAVKFGDAEGLYTTARSFKRAVEKIQFSL